MKKQVPMPTPICQMCAERITGNLKRALGHHQISKAFHRIIVNQEGGHGWPGFYDVCGRHGKEVLERLDRQGKRAGVDFGVDENFWARLKRNDDG